MGTDRKCYAQNVKGLGVNSGGCVSWVEGRGLMTFFFFGSTFKIHTYSNI